LLIRYNIRGSVLISDASSKSSFMDNDPSEKSTDRHPNVPAGGCHFLNAEMLKNTSCNARLRKIQGILGGMQPPYLPKCDCAHNTIG
ncbi:MAG: hypothetical protein SOY75_05375, partial [Peptoniphilaceae bacterium]|nr:hypothetical protein [Peptoniphilaceae bacterium]